MELPQVDAVMKSTVSVRDKLKKRREALGSILSGISPAAEPKPEAEAAGTSGTSEKAPAPESSAAAKKDCAEAVEAMPAEKKLKLAVAKEHG
jgi:hypothetical protein